MVRSTHDAGASYVTVSYAIRGDAGGEIRSVRLQRGARRLPDD
jgi:hypothetical protein